MFKKIMKDEKGFTLVELVIVIAIMAILSGLLIPRIVGNVGNAKREGQISNAHTIASELTVYNANQKVTDGTMVVSKNPLAATDLPTDLTLPNSVTFPDSKYATIVVDAKGNASVVVTPETP